jgi:ATP-dependent DNA ligase
LERRKAAQAKLLTRAGDGISFNEHVADDGAVVFEAACRMGLEGIVSKRLGAPYRSGRSGDWVKTKKPGQPGGAALARGKLVSARVDLAPIQDYKLFQSGTCEGVLNV